MRNRPAAVFDNKHPKVKDDKDHFPIDTIGRARNALARSHQYDKSPSWWGGSLSELQNAVARAVKKKYPSIEVGGNKKKTSKASEISLSEEDYDEFLELDSLSNDQLIEWINILETANHQNDPFHRLIMSAALNEMDRRNIYSKEQVEIAI